ncbi:MAG: thiolase family protein [Hyphomonadaceae bacterium]
MRDVSIIGVGMSRFGKQPEASLDDIAHPAILEAMRDAGVAPRDIEAAYCGSVFARGNPCQRILKGLGVFGVPMLNVDNACSSGSSALRDAYIAIGAGLCDVALAFGVDKLTALGGGALPVLDGDVEGSQGVIMPAIYAMRARRHMEEFGTTRRQLAQIAVKNHRNSAHNPKAQYRDLYTLDQVLNSRPVADPLTLLQCCPTGDGAAAAVLVASECAGRFESGAPIRIRASALRSGEFTDKFRDMTKSHLTIDTARIAYEAAGLGPEDVDLLEVHDAFTIGELMYYEALGLVAHGEGGRVVDEGLAEIGGRFPVNPSGGLLSKGHPVGATGVAQIYEVVNQLRGRCGPRQVENARIGLTHCTGGGAAGFDHVACTIHILERPA